MGKLKRFLIFSSIAFFLFMIFFVVLSNQNDQTKKNVHLIKMYNKYILASENFRVLGEFTRALKASKDALRFSRKLGGGLYQVQSLIRIGLLYWNEGEIEKSFDTHNKALRLAEFNDIKNEKRLCSNYFLINKLYREGKYYRKSGKFKESIDCFNKAISMAKENNYPEYEVKCLRQLSVTYYESNNIDEFYFLNEKALKIALNLHHRNEEGGCLNNIGLYFEENGDYSNALKYYEEALKIAKETKNKKEHSNCITNISNIYSYLGNYDKALTYMELALKIDKQLKNTNYISMDFNNIGEAYRNKWLISKKENDKDRALGNFIESLGFSRKSKDKETEVKVLNNIGLIYMELNDYEKALNFFKNGLSEVDKMNNFELMSMILTNISTVYFNQRKYQNSIKYYKKSIDLAHRVSAKNILWEAYFGLGRCYEMINDLSQAQVYYEKALVVIEQIKSHIFLVTNKAGFSRDKLIVYESLLNLQYDLNQKKPYDGFNNDIFHLVENIKAKAFFESLNEGKIDFKKNLTPELKEKERNISREISQILFELRGPNVSKKMETEFLRNLEMREDEYLSLMMRVKSEIPLFANLISPEPINLKKLQNQYIDEKIAIIEYFLGEKKSFLFLITHNDFKLFLLPPREEIKKSVEVFLKVLSTPTQERYIGVKASKRLYQELLFPLEGVSASVENIIIIPDGTLYYLPFETLKIGNKYIIDKYRISYAPSSSSLAVLCDRRKKSEMKKSLLAFGNPIYSKKKSKKKGNSKSNIDVLREIYLSQGFDFSPLPYSEKEVLEISSFFQEERKNIYLGDKAQENIIKNSNLEDYQIIHFACHGFLNKKFPFRSALVLTLADETEEDGFLQVREIYTLRLNADLIVLSACQTGKGRLERGEGILGLPRIFFYAGASSVITTLWKIKDKSTSEFMKYFYNYLSLGKNKTQALQLAKLKMMNSQYSHPYYWAAFVLNGEFNTSLEFN